MGDAATMQAGYVPRVSVYGATQGYEKIPTSARSWGVR